MCSTGRSIHLSGGDGPVPASFLHFFFDGIISVNIVFGEPLNIDTKCFVLSDFMSFLRPFRDGNQQVLDFFIINFEHGDVDLILFALILVIFDSAEDLLARNRNDTLIE